MQPATFQVSRFILDNLSEIDAAFRAAHPLGNNAGLIGSSKGSGGTISIIDTTTNTVMMITTTEYAAIQTALNAAVAPHVA